MERRLVLRLIAAGFLAPRGLVSIAEAQSPSPYEPSFFSAKEMLALDRLTEILIPADDHSPGASSALVNRYIDVVVGDGSASAQATWKSGLKIVDRQSKQSFGKPFRKLDAAEQEQVVAMMAANEGSPTNDLERFFTPLKAMTISGYYTSKIGIHEDLQYQGNVAVSEFAGCTHPEHQV